MYIHIFYLFFWVTICLSLFRSSLIPFIGFCGFQCTDSVHVLLDLHLNIFF